MESKSESAAGVQTLMTNEVTKVVQVSPNQSVSNDKLRAEVQTPPGMDYWWGEEEGPQNCQPGQESMPGGDDEEER